MQDEIFAQIIAAQCYLLHGTNANKKEIERVIRTFNFHRSKTLLTKNKRRWAQLVEASFEKVRINIFI